MRICALINCGNSTYHIDRWKKELCEVHGDFHESDSGNCNCQRPFALFPFPCEKSDPEGRRRWTRAVNRKTVQHKGGRAVQNWIPTYDSRVCSDHFVDGRPSDNNPDPTLCLGYIPCKRILSTRPSPRERKCVSTSHCPTKSKKCKADDSTEDRSVNHVNIDHSEYSIRCSCKEGCDCIGCIRKQKRIDSLKHENELLKTKLKTKHKPVEKHVKYSNICLKSDINVKSYTGLTSVQACMALCKYVTPSAKRMTYWIGTKRSVSGTKIRHHYHTRKCGPLRKLTIVEELSLVLMKLRMGLTNRLLADMFGISPGTCSTIFNTWIKMLATKLKPLIFWPNKQTVTDLLPPILRKKFPQLRCTLDCTEIFIERPRHLELQAQTWSDYKKHNTVKFLVAIAPNGMINFISKAWGGRTSDRHITRESGFLDLVDPNDTILADRGFTIQEDLLLRHATLYIPPPSSGLEQQMRKDVLKTKTIANARIHVERAIGRLKWFKILKNTLPITLVPIVDDIISVCSALCNLLPPLVS